MTAWNGTPDEPEKRDEARIRHNLSRYMDLLGDFNHLSYRAEQAKGAMGRALRDLIAAGGEAEARKYAAPQPPADLQAAGAAGALAMRAAAAGLDVLPAPTSHIADTPDLRTTWGLAIHHYKVAISALPLPNPDALAAAVAEAHARGLEEGASICRTFARNVLEEKGPSAEEPEHDAAMSCAGLLDTHAARVRTRPTGGGSGT